MATRTFRIWRGDKSGGELREYKVDVDEGMVVLDVVHRIQSRMAPDLAVRWNCKAGKCGSCSCEINGKPRLSCMTRMDTFGADEVVTVQPVKTFPIIKDLVTDVAWNYRQKRRIPPFRPRQRDADGNYRMMQEDVDRIQEFRKCIECYLCQDVCHILRDQQKQDEFIGPRFMIFLANLDMHPLDTADRLRAVRDDFGSGYCNITKCCTEVCPEHINITDNGIIPLKERVVDRFYDPIARLLNGISGKKREPAPALDPDA
jgi:succinate dehydrogenase / fumarate reductase iron-sulfur subunit